MTGRQSWRVPDLDSLRLLLDVATLGSISAAAHNRGISQPTATTRMRTMETTLGFPVVRRTPRGSLLTPEGALVVEWAREVVGAAQSLNSAINALRTDHHNHLQVSASLTIAEHLLPRWLVLLTASQPEVAVQLTAQNSADVAAAVLAGSSSLGFIEAPEFPSGLAHQVVGFDRLVLVVPPDHPWAKVTGAVTPAELEGVRLVQREPLSGTRQWLESALGGDSAPPLLELSSTAGVVGAVAAGAGPAVLSELAVSAAAAAGVVVPVALQGNRWRRTLRAVWLTGNRPAGAAAELLRIARRDGRTVRSKISR